jgi:ABC-type sulfate transport system permease subunit
MPRRLVIIKKEEIIILIVLIKTTEFVTKVITQPIKATKVILQYPYIICYSVKHWLGDYLKKSDVQKMFHTKINRTTPIVLKLGKLDMLV